MYADAAHGHGRLAALVLEFAERCRSLWAMFAAALRPQPAPAEIDWEDGESR
jgi:hypothetical protein